MKIMLDMDGVLCDFDYWLDYNNARKENGKTDWKKLHQIGSSYWGKMPWVVEGHRLYLMLLEYVKDKPDLSIGIHSAFGMSCGKVGKHYWLENNCPEIDKKLVKIDNDGHFKFKNGAVDEILVDDRIANVESYQDAGFPAVLFTNADETFSNVIKLIEGKNEAQVQEVV